MSRCVGCAHGRAGGGAGQGGRFAGRGFDVPVRRATSSRFFRGRVVRGGGRCLSAQVSGAYPAPGPRSGPDAGGVPAGLLEATLLPPRARPGKVERVERPGSTTSVVVLSIRQLTHRLSSHPPRPVFFGSLSLRTTQLPAGRASKSDTYVFGACSDSLRNFLSRSPIRQCWCENSLAKGPARSRDPSEF